MAYTRGSAVRPRIPWSRRRWRRGRCRSRSPGRSAGWTDKLPEDCREAADTILAGAARSGMDLRDLAGLAGEIYARSLPGDPGRDEDEAFEDRSVKLETTFEGAGVLIG